MMNPDIHFAAPSRYAVMPPHCRERFARQAPPATREGSATVTTSDGHPLVLRPIEPSDIGALRRSFARLPAQTVRGRLQQPTSTLPMPLALRLCRIDPARESTYVLMDASVQPSELRGMGRMSVDEAADRAEFSVLVERPWSDLGLEAQLLQRLVDDGRRRGLAELWAFVSVANQLMLETCQAHGFEQRRLPDRPGTAQLTLKL